MGARIDALLVRLVSTNPERSAPAEERASRRRDDFMALPVARYDTVTLTEVPAPALQFG